MDRDVSDAKGLFTAEEGALLIRLARLTIRGHLGLAVDPRERASVDAALAADGFQVVRGTFVTLTQGGSLRGCIGHLTGVATVPESVRQNAISAGFHDPRFPALTAAELKSVAIEISILTVPRPLAFSDADDLVQRLRPGIDGVILSQAAASATFLPQVWQQLPEAEGFLSHLCLKAGLPLKSWRAGDVAVSTYQVQAFEEHA